MFAPGGAEANKERVLHVFSGGSDGAYPHAPPIIGEDGNLYGATYLGGVEGLGYGVVFKLVPGGAETVLYTFHDGADGYGPFGGVVRDKLGNLYGTSLYEGAGGDGTVFKLTPDGKEIVLHSFGDGDAEYPISGLLRDKHGNLYGATLTGGANDDGAIFKLAPDGTESVLHSFSGADGDLPQASLVRDAEGNLYGTASAGGAGNCIVGCGTVFRLSPKGKLTVLHSFGGGGSDGATPYSGLTLDEAGNLYGTASAGGGGSCDGGCGVVFELAPDGTETVLHSFSGDKDGALPIGRLMRDSDGSLFGVASAGADNACDRGCGVVFKLASDETFSVLHAFKGGATDGAYPAGVTMDRRGNLFGATTGGGNGCDGYGCGTIFEIRR
jgi:uncharacterized repeat protein (TIGR03803 family)